MLTFLRSHWLVITICLAYTLLTTGAAYYFVRSATHENQAAFLKVTQELKTAKGTLEKSSAESTKAKEALDKEKVLNADLKKMLAAAEQERVSLKNTLETMTLAAAKSAKPQAEKTKTPPVVASAACREKNAATEKDIKNQQRELQTFQADVYKRDAELRERQKQLDETMAKITEEKRKLDRERAEYRWPHNGSQSNK